STPGNGADLVVAALRGLVSLDVARTAYRGHARELAASTSAELVVVLGGDGAINEAVNGLMERSGPRPLLAVLPGGGGNVFAQTIGMPTSATRAIDVLAGLVASLVASGDSRSIGLGLAGDRYFTFSAGVGMDAEVVHEVDQARARGRRESPALFARAILRRYYGGTERRVPVLTLDMPGRPPIDGLFMGIVMNSAPWTYLHGLPLLSRPFPDFSSGLDVLALNRLAFRDIVGAVGKMLLTARRRLGPRGSHMMTAYGLDTVTFRCSRPAAFHVDGEYLGEVESVKFQFVPDALRVVAPPRPRDTVTGQM
ncbi:MAG TPA: diacylglycerol kinase family protein, partial [Actinomycetota bacterium]|nr:diacylglycerol kinase family protein [Actinomycetota bacterium]